MQKMCEEGSVITCQSVQCSWNRDEKCFAPSIEVGDECPECDTFTMQPIGEMAQDMSEVSHCDAIRCELNEQERCTASGITVGNHAGHADCYTFRP